MPLTIQFSKGSTAYPIGSAELAYSDLDTPIAMAAFSDITPTTYLWELIDKPEGSASVIANATTAAPMLSAPDIPGTYLIRCIVNPGLAGEARATAYVSYATEALGLRIPAYGETNESGNRGWAAAIADAIAETAATADSALTLGQAALPAAQKGVANGVCGLDSSAKVAASNMPTYVASVNGLSGDVSIVVGDVLNWIRVFGDGTGDYTTLTAALAANTQAGACFIVAGEVTEPNDSFMVLRTAQHLKFAKGTIWNWGYACTLANCTYADSPTTYSGVSIESEGPVDVRILTGHALAPGTGEIGRRHYARFYFRGPYSCVDLSRATLLIAQRHAIASWYPSDVLPITAEHIALICASGCDLGKWIINHRIAYAGISGWQNSTVSSAIYIYWGQSRNCIKTDILAYGSSDPIALPGYLTGVTVMGGNCYGNRISGVIHDVRWGTSKGYGVLYGQSGTSAAGGIVDVSWNATLVASNTIPAGCKDLTASYTAS